MRKILEILCMTGIFMALLSGCSNCNENNKEAQSSVTDSIIINEVHVTEQPLSEINTIENDWFASNYHNHQPFIDSNGDLYYYVTHMRGDSIGNFLCYDDGVNGPKEIGLPETDHFTVGAILDGTIYGVEHNAGDANDLFIAKFQNNSVKRLFESPIEGCYFAEEGIYYQRGNIIYLMDYSGNNSKRTVEIPVELHVDSIHSNFIVYRGKLWYSYDDFFKEYYYPLWCYDFDGTFTKFDNGGLEAVNNGYLYYKDKDDKLYRFNCETFSAEPVCENIDVLNYSFYKNSVLCTTYDDNDDGRGLYRIHSNDKRKILSPKQLDLSEYISVVSCSEDRIFITGDSGLFYTCLAEIDINGNIIKIIHKDEN